MAIREPTGISRTQRRSDRFLDIDDQAELMDKAISKLKQGLSVSDISFMIESSKWGIAEQPLTRAVINNLSKIVLKKLYTFENPNLFSFLLHTGCIIEFKGNYYLVSFYKRMLEKIAKSLTNFEELENILINDIVIDTQSPFSVSYNQGEALKESQVMSIFQEALYSYLKRIAGFGEEFESIVEGASLFIAISLFLSNLENYSYQLFTSDKANDYSKIRRDIEDRVKKHLEQMNLLFDATSSGIPIDEKILQISAACTFFASLVETSTIHYEDLKPIIKLLSENLDSFEKEDIADDYLDLINLARNNLKVRDVKKLSSHATELTMDDLRNSAPSDFE